MKEKIYYLLVLVIVIKFSKADICDLLSDVSKTNISSKCLTQLETVCKNSSLFFNMFDASSKYPITGLLYSTNQDFGNYDECIAIKHEDMNGQILGKHCTFGVVVVNPLLPLPNTKSLESFPDKTLKVISDPKELRADEVNYTVTYLSVCIPDQCTTKEVGSFFIPIDTGLLYYPELFCATVEHPTVENGDIAFIVFLSIILLLIIASTSYDILLYYLDREAKQPVFLAFSFLSNGRKLLHISKSGGEQISCLNGLRFISMIWVLAGHGYVVWQTLPLTNKGALDDWRYHWYNQYIASAPIAVDTFFFLSGFLWAYGYLKINLNAPPVRQIMGIPLLVLHRYLRLTPAAAALYFTSITIFKHLGAGPLYLTVADTLSTQCRRRWWEFFLYVQNYVNYDDICLNHTWYLSADMQMFILSPLVLIPTAMFAKKKLKLVLAGLGILTLLCTIFPIVIRFVDETYNNNYDTHSRLVDYLIGIMLGIVWKQLKDKPFLFTKMQNLIIWFIVLFITLAWNIYYNAVIATYDHTEDTLFYGLYRPLWVCALAWIVYSCHHGHGGFINWILSRPIFQVGARISYCMYLLHAVVEAHWLGMQRTPGYFSNWSIFYVFGGHFIVTMLLSALWSLSFESPMIIIEKILFSRGGKKNKNTNA